MEKDQLLAHEIRDAVSRVHKHFRRQMNSRGQLSEAEMGVFRVLVSTKETSPSDLCKELNMSSQFMSQVLNRLEEVKYIQRKPSPDDKRKTLVTLTKTGKNLVQEIYDEREEWLTDIIAERFTAEEKKTISKAMALLVRIVE